jgi:hypothetical protein
MFVYAIMNLFITLHGYVNKSRTSAGSISLKDGGVNKRKLSHIKK